MVSTSRALVAFSLLLLPFAFGCSTATTKSDGGRYLESSTDMKDHAPSQVRLPAQVEKDGQPIIDPVQVRSQADYHFTLAESYGLEGNTARSIEEYKLTLVYDPDSTQVRIRLAAEYVKQGLVSEAVAQTKAALEIDPKFEDAHLLLGGLYSAQHLYEDALAQYRIVMTQSPENLEAPMFMGALLAEQKKFTEAAGYFEKLAKDTENPNAHTALYYLGRVKLEENRQKNLSKAEASFRDSLKLKPGYVDAALALGQLLETSGRKTQAVQFYQGFQEKSGPNADIAEELARFYIEDHDYARAYEQFEIIDANDAKNINIKSKMAFILIEEKKYNEAIVKLEEVLSIDPASDKIRFYLGAVYEELKDYSGAIASFKQITTESSYYKEAVIHTAYLYKLNADYDKAIVVIQAGIKNVEDHAPFYALYASLLDETKRYKQGQEMLVKAVEKFPKNAQLMFFLGNMQDKLGDKTATMNSMRRVLEIDKDHIQAMNFLAYLYAEANDRLDDAEKLVRRALELQPGDGYFMDTLGWVLFKKGMLPDAIKYLEAAYKMQPEESVIAEHLGDAYYQNQLPEKAKRLYMRAAENESNVAQAEKIRAKMYSVDHQVQSVQSAQAVGGNERKPASAKTPKADTQE
jgi:tetratricopeptide (TPR) repeat protein